MMKIDAVSNPRSRLKWDTFLSFQRETSHKFTGPLYEAFIKEQVRVWNDDVECGDDDDDELGPSLVEAIDDSLAYVIVLSRNYANSHLRLEELAMICDRLRSPLKRLVFPIFYKVEPWEVKNQLGPFEEDFNEYSKRFGEEKIQRWRSAMVLVGNIAGLIYGKETVKGDDEKKDLVVDDIKKVDEMIGRVVKKVLAEVRNSPEKMVDYTVGLESRMKELMELLHSESSSGVQILGLYGMGGIGKTTLAKRFYNKVIVNFEDRRVFIENVREKLSTQDGLNDLKITLSRKLFQGQSVDDEKKEKILAVLDDVDHIDQVNELVGGTRRYGEGSIIVITTRDEEILNSLSVNQRYEVKCLNETDALKLFSYYSLRKEKPTESLLELSKNIVKITGLLPLAVQVFGSHLYDKDESEWKVQLEKLKTQPDKLHGVLALSFESLEDEEKKIFLDIACLFLKMEITKEEVVDILKGCGYKAEAALSILRQKSLVKIMKDDTFWMHDQIRDMGRNIVLKESSEDPGMRSRLWDRREIMNILNYTKGTTSIRGIVFDFKKKFTMDQTAVEFVTRNLHKEPGIKSMFSYVKNKFVRSPAEEKPKSSEITIPVKPFKSMENLRLLQINNVELEGDLKLLPSELKWIQWKGCPLENLPPYFLDRQLAVLDLSESGIRQIQTSWNKKVDENLRVVNLRGCHRLEAIPDLSNHKALEKLVFELCNLLVKVPRSVGNIKTLLHLDLRRCSNLSEFLVDVSGLKHLENLYLSGCSNLTVLPENIGTMPCLMELFLDGTAINKLPDSISDLRKLKKLSLMGCRSIEKLPEGIGKLTSLEELFLDDTALQELPSSIDELQNLQKLYLRHCASLSKIPDSINELKSLKELFLNGSRVEELPLKSGSLLCSSLTDFSAGDCKSLKQVPSSIGGLDYLLQLQLDNTPIETLPKEIGGLRMIRKLELNNCKFLKVLPESIGDMDKLESLHLVGSNIEELPEAFGKLEKLEILRMNNCKMLKRLPKTFGYLKSLHHLYMQETSVVELPESFGNLSSLMVLKMLKKPLFRSSESDDQGTSEEPRFAELPNSFSNLLSLEELDARSWGISGKIQDDFEKLSSLRILYLGNNYFHSLPTSLKGLSKLKELSLYDCRELKCLPPLPWQLKLLNLANCFSLETISNLSNLKILHELNLTNCGKVEDVPGLEHLKVLKRLYMTGCKSSCASAVKQRLSKASLKMLQNLSLPGNRIPDWFSQGPVTFSAQPNRELRGVVLAVVVALETGDDYPGPDVVGVQAQILSLGQPLFSHTLHLSGVPRKSDDQFHICRYSAAHPMVTLLKDGFTMQVIKAKQPIIQGFELKIHGIHLVYEGDDDFSDEEDTLTEKYKTVSQKLAIFFSSLVEGEASSKGASGDT